MTIIDSVKSRKTLACAELPHEARPLLQNINFPASAL
jgi:hypothetical protein